VSDPDEAEAQVYEAEEHPLALVVPRGDTAGLLEPAEQPLDAVPLLVRLGVVWLRGDPVALRRDGRLDPPPAAPLAEGVSI
jgi:hypothetical protein